mmetsp:Transcript_44246/g.114960  ORF Transcript_44246/g.114960 Transcript_44246/m.114960 type:complete len:222 (+) Transcript_44246:748-1413(+)
MVVTECCHSHQEGVYSETSIRAPLVLHKWAHMLIFPAMLGNTIQADRHMRLHFIKAYTATTHLQLLVLLSQGRITKIKMIQEEETNHKLRLPAHCTTATRDQCTTAFQLQQTLGTTQQQGLSPPQVSVLVATEEVHHFSIVVLLLKERITSVTATINRDGINAVRVLPPAATWLIFRLPVTPPSLHFPVSKGRSEKRRSALTRATPDVLSANEYIRNLEPY